jgi:hypothetical protein
MPRTGSLPLHTLRGICSYRRYVYQELAMGRVVMLEPVIQTPLCSFACTELSRRALDCQTAGF